MNNCIESFLVKPEDIAEFILATHYCVYDHPKDFPNEYVVRRWFMVKDRDEPLGDINIFMRTNDLQQIRESMQKKGLYRIPHQPGEDEAILETWI